MSDAFPLPPRPNLDHYKKLAKDLQHACQSSDPQELHDWAARWVASMVRLLAAGITPEVEEQAAATTWRIQHRWQEFQKRSDHAARCALSAAQFFIARSHGFASWPKFASHLQGLARDQSPVSTFEAAVDAIVNGDSTRLEQLLRDHPELVHARSTREHRSTLLHYVSANGVEDFRQKTPLNIVEIAALLLKAGADVNAESDAYAGRSTTLGLTATSYHPDAAGVQIPLMELLLDHGAVIDGPDSGSGVIGCLQNGRAQAAEFLANHGARLDLATAAGAGRLDVVQSYFNDDGSLKPSATQERMLEGFQWACDSGRAGIVDFLLRHGVSAGAKLSRGETGLHWAAYKGDAAIVKLLLRRGAPADVIEGTYDGTPLAWALYGWGNSKEPRSYYEVVAMLVQAGATTVDPEWFQDDRERRRAAARIRSDPKMQAALRGEIPGVA